MFLTSFRFLVKPGPIRYGNEIVNKILFWGNCNKYTLQIQISMHNMSGMCQLCQESITKSPLSNSGSCVKNDLICVRVSWMESHRHSNKGTCSEEQVLKLREAYGDRFKQLRYNCTSK